MDSSAITATNTHSSTVANTQKPKPLSQSPSRTDLTVRNKSSMWRIGLHMQKVMHSEVAYHEQKNCFLFENHCIGFFYGKFIWDQERIRGFMTHIICCSHWHECVEIPACFSWEKCLSPLVSTPNFNLSSDPTLTHTVSLSAHTKLVIRTISQPRISRWIHDQAVFDSYEQSQT